VVAKRSKVGQGGEWGCVVVVSGGTCAARAGGGGSGSPARSRIAERGRARSLSPWLSKLPLQAHRPLPTMH